MKKILVITMFVLLAAVNVAIITNKNDGSNLSLNSLLKVAMAIDEYTPPSTTEPKDSTKVGYWKYDNVLKQDICTPSGTAC